MSKNEILIHGNDNPVLSVTLSDILNSIKQGEKFYWSILWLRATGTLKNKSVLDLEEDINKSEKGLLIEWNNLCVLAKQFHQVNEIVLIGDTNKSKLVRYNNDDEMKSNCYYVIELVDSAYWAFYCMDENVLDELKSNFEGVENV
jgi:hypothetical protein